MSNGFWRLEHTLHKAILRQGLSGESLRTWLALGALTLGFNKQRDIVTAGQIARFAGLTRRGVHRALAELERLGLVGKQRVAPRKTERWIIGPDSVEDDTTKAKGSVKGDTRHSVEDDTTDSVKGDTPLRIKKEKNTSVSSRPKQAAVSKVNCWRLWIDVSRSLGRPDPLSVGPDLAASKSLAKLIAGGELTEADLKGRMAAFLKDGDDFLKKQGHPLRLLPGRIGAYQATREKARLPEWKN